MFRQYIVKRGTDAKMGTDAKKGTDAKRAGR